MASNSNNQVAPTGENDPYSNGVPGPAYSDPVEQKSVSEQLELMIDLLYRRKWTILCMFLIVFSGFATYVYMQPPVYQTGSLVMLELTGNERSQSSSSNQSLSVTEDRFFASNRRSLTSELFLLQNSGSIDHRVAERVISLAKERKELASSLTVLPGGPDESQYYADSVAARLERYVSFQPAATDINAIRIAAQSPQSGEAALLANLYAEEYVQLTQDESRSNLSAKRKSLEQQAQQRREELRAIEKEIENYVIEHGVTGEGRQGSDLMEEISSLRETREEAQFELEQHQSTLNSLQERVSQFEESVSTGIEASGLQRRIESLQQRIAELETQKEEIFLQYPQLRSPDSTNANLRQLNGQIAQLEKQVDQLTQQYVEKVRSSEAFSGTEGNLSALASLKQRINEEQTAIDRLQARVEVTNQRIAAYQSRLDSVPEQSLELRQLRRKQENAQQMYNMVVQQLQETQIAEESEPGYAHILQKASPAPEAERPGAFRLLILGCFLGLMAGMGVALIRDKLDNRIYKPEQASASGGLIGVVPSMDEFIRDHHGGRKFAEYKGREVETTLISLLNPGSAISEAYRQVRTRLRHGRSAGAKVKSLVVSSAGTKDGKSVTAANLAVTMAQSGQRTVLVDGDLRRPRIHEIFDLNITPGLVHLYQDENRTDVITEVVPNLHVVPAGRAIGNAAELIESDQMRRLFERLHREYDRVVVDTPPSLVVSDASIFSTYCDGVIIVCRAGQTREKEIKDVIETFGDVGGHVVGLLLNEFDISSAYGRKYTYREYEQYGSYFEGDQQIVEVGTYTDGDQRFKG